MHGCSYMEGIHLKRLVSKKNNEQIRVDVKDVRTAILDWTRGLSSLASAHTVGNAMSIYALTHNHGINGHVLATWYERYCILLSVLDIIYKCHE